MKRLSLSSHSLSELAAQAARVLLGGGLVLMPTETVYALVCDPRQEEALERLYQAKKRLRTHPLAFVASSPAQAGNLVSLDSKLAREIAARYWPGPLTLILPLSGRDRLAEWNWGETLAVRVPAHEVSREVAERAGSPLPATSANLSGEPTAPAPEQLPEELARQVDLCLDAGTLKASPPSTILDLAGRTPRLVRAGAIPAKDLEPWTGPLSFSGSD